MRVVFAVCAVRIVRVVSEFRTTLSVCCVCVGSAVAVGVAIVVFNVTWVFVAFVRMVVYGIPDQHQQTASHAERISNSLM